MTLKKALLRGIIGIPVGVFISTTIGVVISLIQGNLAVTPPVAAGTSPLTAYLNQYIISIFVGFVFGLGSAIFEVDNWSIAKQTMLHFILSSGVFTPCAVIARWIEPKFLDIVVYLLVFVIIYIMIWCIQYFTWKNRIAKLNKKLEKR